MNETRFDVDATFDIPGRGGLLAAGIVSAGEIQAGTLLYNPATGGIVPVLAVEFDTPATQGTNRATLVVEREAAGHAYEGAVLVSTE